MIIQSVADLTTLQHKLEHEPAFVLPIFVDQDAHPVVNPLSSLHFLFGDDSSWCVPYIHPDASPLTLDMTTASKLLTLHKRDLMHLFPKFDHTKIVDCAAIRHLAHLPIPTLREYFAPSTLRLFQRHKFRNLHLSIPLVKWADYATALLTKLKDEYPLTNIPGSDFINNVMIPTLTSIERAGLHVDPTILEQHFGELAKRNIINLVYSEYNPYTSTGRPSNAFGGINYAALNKHDGTRAAFTSRYGEDGLLIQFDYEAFHLRLIAEKIGYKLPEDSVHTYLAKQYYNTDDITPEQYEESKKRTFSIMYGMTNDLGGVEFFYKVREYAQSLWFAYERDSYITTRTGKQLLVPDPSPNKVFNYSIQWMETEEAMARIADVCALLEGHLTKPILYTYDALLIDLHRSETAMLPRIRTLLEGGVYRTRMYKGKNYNELTLI